MLSKVSFWLLPVNVLVHSCKGNQYCKGERIFSELLKKSAVATGLKKRKLLLKKILIVLIREVGHLIKLLPKDFLLSILKDSLRLLWPLDSDKHTTYVFQLKLEFNNFWAISSCCWVLEINSFNFAPNFE